MAFEYVRTSQGNWIRRRALIVGYEGYINPYEPTDFGPDAALLVSPTLPVLLESDEGAFTMGEIAVALAVKEATVRRLIKDGELKAIKFRGTVRILRDHLNEFLAASLIQPGEEPSEEPSEEPDQGEDSR